MEISSIGWFMPEDEGIIIGPVTHIKFIRQYFHAPFFVFVFYSDCSVKVIYGTNFQD